MIAPHLVEPASDDAQEPGVEPVLSLETGHEERGQVERPHGPIARNAEREVELGGGVVAGREGKAPDTARELHGSLAVRTSLHDEGPVLGEKMADGLVERGAKGIMIRVAEEPTHMRREADAIVGMVDQAHQRLDLVEDGDGLEHANAVR